MGMKVNYTIYLVRDSHGNEDYAVANSESNYIDIDGLETKNYESVVFESSAFTLQQWCKDNDFEYREIEKEVDWKI